MTQPPPPPGPPPEGQAGPPSESPTEPPAQPPPPAPARVPAPAVAAPPAYPAPVAAPIDRIRAAYQRRNETDYVFDFWSAFGWTLLTCGIYQIYVVYQLVRRSRDHNTRRLEELDAATTFAWDRAGERGLQDELRPNFERIATRLAVVRHQTTEFRDPTVWLVLAIFARGIVEIVAFVLLDGDLVKHDYNEGGVEHELAEIYTRLGAPLSSPDPARLHQAHNYVARVIVTLVTCGLYSLWWEYDVMTQLNRHFEENWAWEDALAGSVQSLAA